MHWKNCGQQTLAVLQNSLVIPVVRDVSSQGDTLVWNRLRDLIVLKADDKRCCFFLRMLEISMGSFSDTFSSQGGWKSAQSSWCQLHLDSCTTWSILPFWSYKSATTWGFTSWIRDIDGKHCKWVKCFIGLIAKWTLDETGLSHKNAAVSKHLIQLTQGVLMVNWNPITRQRLINSPTHVSCPHVWTELDPGHLVITKERFKIPYNHYRSYSYHWPKDST